MSALTSHAFSVVRHVPELGRTMAAAFRRLLRGVYDQNQSCSGSGDRREEEPHAVKKRGCRLVLSFRIPSRTQAVGVLLPTAWRSQYAARRVLPQLCAYSIL